MKKVFFALVFLWLQISCQNQPIAHKPGLYTQVVAINTNSDISNKTAGSESQEDEEKYPGVTIDQQFPFIELHDFMEANLKGETYAVKADKFEVTVKKFAPKTLRQNGKSIFRFTTLNPNEYHSNIVGISQLLGKNSKQIYVVATGPGAVCCTNYWITDVSGGKPRSVFRSEDFGSFRDPMEVFDADNDGIYELVQFDSAFRYFLGDCGACSPEPRAVFKYDKKSATYLPAKNLQQDFIKEYYSETEKWVVESFGKLKKEETPELKTEYARRFLEYVVGLFYLGNEKKAWTTFDKYYIGFYDKQEVRGEIKHRLKQSKFFQALKKSS